MTGAEADAILAILVAAYPEKSHPPHELTEAETATWERHLAPLDFDVAVATAERIIDHQKWFPRVSEFLQVASPLKQRQLMAAPRAIESVASDDDYRARGRAHIDRLRAQLRGEGTA